jgi:3-oxoacyl-[acyl-carrier-protein] synthase II
VTLFDPAGLPCRVAAQVTDFDAKKIVAKESRKGLKVMARTVQLGLSASTLAMADGGPAKGTIDPFRFGVEFACVMVATELDDLAAAAKESTTSGMLDFGVWGTRGLELVPPLWMLKYLPNMPACHTSIEFDAQGPNNTITEADAAGLLALGEAHRIMGRGLADYFLVGGCESKINPLSLTRHNLFAPLTRENDSPGTAIRPYASDAAGTALGEGAACLGLETREHATARGAKIYGELLGFATGFDRGLTGKVLATVIRNALREANVAPAEIDHVNAHGLGVLELDAFEARGIAEVFGATTPVVSYAGHLGNAGAASGLLELTASLLAYRHGVLPGTLNCPAPSPRCNINIHSGAPRPIVKPYFVKVSFTDMGQVAAVVVKRGE